MLSMKKELKFKIVYEDKSIIVVYKKSGLLSIATNDGDLNNLYHYVREYVNKKNEKIFIVHRLDKDTSGIMIFAKSIKIKMELQSYFENREVIRKYEAVVKNKVDLNKVFHVEQYLLINHKTNQIYITKDKKKGKLAITDIKANNYLNNDTVLDIDIKTGRQNQIRIALKSLNLTLIGDKKYAYDNSNRMMLNAYEIIFPKNSSLKEKTFKTNPLWLKN